MTEDAWTDPGGLDRETLRRLSRRSDVLGIRQIALHALLLAGTSTLVFAARGRLWLPPAMLLQGIALDFLFCALHETVHRTAFASRRLNDAVAWVAGALLLLPPEFFRAFHFAHHRFTQDAQRDPELARPPPATLRAYFWLISGIPNWTKRLTVSLRHAITGQVREPFVAAGKRAAVIREARILWGVYAAIFAASVLFRSQAALIYWIVPAMLGQPFLRIYLLAEHAGCGASDDPYANTRLADAVPRRASCLPRRAVPCAGRSQRADPLAHPGDGARLSRDAARADPRPADPTDPVAGGGTLICGRYDFLHSQDFGMHRETIKVSGSSPVRTSRCPPKHCSGICRASTRTARIHLQVALVLLDPVSVMLGDELDQLQVLVIDLTHDLTR
jgi:hypothetical protein